MSGSGYGRYDRSSPEQTPFGLQDVHKKLHNIIRTATIEKMDHNKAVCRLKVGPLQSAWVPWHTRHAGEDADWAPPSAGEQVTMLCPSGDMSQAVFIHGLYQDKFPQPSQNKDERKHNLKDGTSITHNVVDKTRITAMPDGGSHAITAGKQTHYVDANGIRMENDQGVVQVHTDGKIRAQNNAGSHVLDEGGNMLINC